MIGVLHQAIEQYATRLGRETRDERAKIQGRFSDVPLISDVDEVIDLLGRAIISNARHSETKSACEGIAGSISSRRAGTPMIETTTPRALIMSAPSARGSA